MVGRLECHAAHMSGQPCSLMSVLREAQCRRVMPGVTNVSGKDWCDCSDEAAHTHTADRRGLYCRSRLMIST